MTKSFLYSLGIHLLLATLFFALYMQPFPKHEEQKISIKFRSSKPGEQPSMIPQVQKTTPPPAPVEPVSTPVPPKPALTTAAKPTAPAQPIRPTTPITEAPISKPAASATLTVVQPAPQPSVKAPPPPPPVNVEKEYIKLNLAEIRALLIQNQQYPKQAKRLHMQGDVELHFQLNANGSVEDLKVVQSSGFELLDEDAKALILKTAPLFPKPSKSVQLRLPISYVLH